MDRFRLWLYDHSLLHYCVRCGRRADTTGAGHREGSIGKGRREK